MAFARRAFIASTAVLTLGILGSARGEDSQGVAFHSQVARVEAAAAREPSTFTSETGLKLILKQDADPLPPQITYSILPSQKAAALGPSQNGELAPGLYEILVQESGKETFRRPFLALKELGSSLELHYSKAGGFRLRQSIDLPQIKFIPYQKNIAKASIADLKEVVSLLNRHPEIELFGFEVHTDAGGQEEMNRELTEARAIMVRNFLVKHGIDAQRIHAAGLGSSQPIASNDSKESKLQNRRVAFVIEELSEAPKLLGDR